jgi:hypothetical protein
VLVGVDDDVVDVLDVPYVLPDAVARIVFPVVVVVAVVAETGTLPLPPGRTKTPFA